MNLIRLYKLYHLGIQISEKEENNRTIKKMFDNIKPFVSFVSEEPLDIFYFDSKNKCIFVLKNFKIMNNYIIRFNRTLILQDLKFKYLLNDSYIKNIMRYLIETKYNVSI